MPVSFVFLVIGKLVAVFFVEFKNNRQWFIDIEQILSGVLFTLLHSLCRNTLNANISRTSVSFPCWKSKVFQFRYRLQWYSLEIYVNYRFNSTLLTVI